MKDLKTLSCRRRVALLCDYLDGELPAASRRLVAAHRRSCLPCAQVLAGLERTVRALKGLRARKIVPSSSRRALKSALARAARPRR
jgi:anti-sigma factor RsiW